MSDAVQQIKDKLSILDVVSPYVELHKAGKNFKGKSPFSTEKTPSFYVSPDRGMYYCFSTTQGGDIFTFIQAMEGVDFKESLNILAQKAGVELVAEDPKKKTERERLYTVIESATTFYEEKLQREPEALAYLERRAVKPETIAKWRIGYAPGPPKHGWRESKDELEAKNFTRDELLKAGIIKEANSGKEPFDVFRDRVMFPMAEPSGKTVAFSGRILHPDEKAPKYVNSPETLLYKKSDLLFGYDKAKQGIRTIDFSLIVEGQFDVVMCHQAGYSNTVAVSGTALTLHHVQLLERLSDKVVLALDADRAGINAMKKAADVMLRRGLDVKVAEMPLGKDPADIIAKDPLEFKKVIGSSVHVIEFLLHVLKREEKDERTLKRKSREDILPFILLLPDRIDQEHFVGKVAESIGTTTDAVRFELGRLREQASEAGSGMAKENNVAPATSANSLPKKSAADLIHKNYSYLKAVLVIIDAPWKSDLKLALDDVTINTKLDEIEATELSELTFLLEQQFADLSPLLTAEEIVSKLNHLKKAIIRQDLSEHRNALGDEEVSNDEEKLMTVLKQIQILETQLREPAYFVEDFLKPEDDVALNKAKSKKLNKPSVKIKDEQKPEIVNDDSNSRSTAMPEEDDPF